MAHPRGRQPVGFEQPPGNGSNYPFVQPSDDVRWLLADLYLSFDDLKDEITPPLYVDWMYGFGTNPVPQPSDKPIPLHDQDMRIVDANGTVVADTTQAVNMHTSVWDGRMKLLEWYLLAGVLRVAWHTEWQQDDVDAGLTKTYDTHIVPESGELQAHTWYKVPKRVNSLQVDPGPFWILGGPAILKEGYNMSISPDAEVPEIVTPDLAGESKPLVPGTRRKTRIVLSAEPGSGEGVYPGCGDVEPVLRTINKIRSSPHQNFTLDSEGCLRTQRPAVLRKESPREFGYSPAGLPGGDAASTIEMSNDCRNCCDCEYFARTYQGIKRQWFLHRDIAKKAEKSRDLYAENIKRWEASKSDRYDSNLRIRLQADGDCKISWGISLCNWSTCCVVDVIVRLQWIYVLNGRVISNTYMDSYDCLKTTVDGSAQCNGPEPAYVDWYNPYYHPTRNSFGTITLPYMDPQSLTLLQGRHCFTNCRDFGEGNELAVQMIAFAWLDNVIPPTPDDPPCAFRSLAIDNNLVPLEEMQIWEEADQYRNLDYENVHAVVKSPPIAVNGDSPYCERCECPPEETDEGTSGVII